MVGVRRSIDRDLSLRIHQLRLVCGDATLSFFFGALFDTVFSNVALQWIPEQDAVPESISDVLMPDGQFVVEDGGSGQLITSEDKSHACLCFFTKSLIKTSLNQ